MTTNLAITKYVLSFKIEVLKKKINTPSSGLADVLQGGALQFITGG